MDDGSPPPGDTNNGASHDLEPPTAASPETPQSPSVHFAGIRSHKVRIKIEDIDDELPSLVAYLRLGARTTKVEQAVRLFLQDPENVEDEDENSGSERPAPMINPSDTIVLYKDGQLLCNEDLLNPPSKIHYRVYYSGETPGDLTPRLYFNSPDKRCAKIFVKNRESLLDDITNSGLTVDGLRNKISNKLGLADPNVVAVSACGGMRPGPLEGGHWEIKRVQSWLCRDIAIEIIPNIQYVVVRGCSKQYLYHPPPGKLNKEGTTVGNIKKWLRETLIPGVHRKCKSQIHVESADILVKDWYLELKNDSSPVPWGSLLDFSLPRGVAEAFIEEQNWLSPIKHTCVVCWDSKRGDEMVDQVTKLCLHGPKVCIKCLQQWIKSAFLENGWERVNCPSCTEPLSFHDVRAHATKTVFERYDTLLAKKLLSKVQNFYWCLSKGCNSGQVHLPSGRSDNSSCPKNLFQCHACGGRQCTLHGVKWHEGRTCREYDAMNPSKSKQDKASEATIKEISKECPKCKRNIIKSVGCNHMTCHCGHQWCYYCREAWEYNEERSLVCKHKPNCPEHNSNPFFYEQLMHDPPVGHGPPPAVAATAFPAVVRPRVEPPPMPPRALQRAEPDPEEFRHHALPDRFHDPPTSAFSPLPRAMSQFMPPSERHRLPLPHPAPVPAPFVPATDLWSEDDDVHPFAPAPRMRPRETQATNHRGHRASWIPQPTTEQALSSWPAQPRGIAPRFMVGAIDYTLPPRDHRRSLPAPEQRRNLLPGAEQRRALPAPEPRREMPRGERQSYVPDNAQRRPHVYAPRFSPRQMMNRPWGE
ncbi:hypothetical protein jhhlp_006846 [Lomentospora prolificans]|uniref:RING-type domain-containing protein n=1 Tax=Lomentospora prolificans TaxID=41688 RepID=A0A2N3N2Y3_9PEZI|nr:hypothetical protein jhhlp_006846 [Lomentospora prolificans]